MKYTLIILSFFLAATACNKVVTSEVNFDVNTTSSTYKVGDTVTFNISGQSNYVIFYSGEFGKEYKNANRGYLTGGKPTVSFNSTASGTILPDTLLKIFVSQNFNGTNSIAGVTAAGWTDITSRFTLSAGVANTPSGSVDISDLILVDSVPVSLAFRYRVPAKRITNWSIQSLTVNTIMPDGYAVPIYSIASGFTAVDFLNAAVKWNASTTTLATSGASATSADSEDWIVSKPFFPYRITMDQGTSIKALADADLTNYKYVFRTPGKYAVTFVSLNSNVYDSKANAITIDLSITP